MPGEAAETTAVIPGSAPAAADQAQDQQGQTQDQQQAASSGSAPDNQETQQQQSQTQAKTETPGSEPAEGEEHKKLRNRAQEAETRASRAELELQQERAARQQSVRMNKKPDISEYNPEDYEKFEQDTEKWYEQKANADARQRAERESLDREFHSRVEKTVTELPDYHETVGKINIPMTPGYEQVVTQIKRSVHGPKMAYFLGKNLNEAYRLANMDPFSAAVEIGRLEARISQSPAPKPEKTNTSAPPPPKPVGTGGSADSDLSKLSSEEYIARTNKERYGY